MLQVLPPRQRAVLLLRDVLALRATEVAALLELTVPAVNSALQRARTTMRATYHPPAERRGPSPDLRPLLDRYVRAWEAADIDGLVGLLSDDAVLTMPPRSSVAGAEAIGAFLAEAIFVGPPMRLLETEANGGPAFAAYGRSSAGDPLEGFAILVLATDGRRVTGMSAFRDPGLIARFGLPTVLPD
jgi:RNA polymerase sigma-70 factor (ECF subfamily)